MIRSRRTELLTDMFLHFDSFSLIEFFRKCYVLSIDETFLFGSRRGNQMKAYDWTKMRTFFLKPRQKIRIFYFRLSSIFLKCFKLIFIELFEKFCAEYYKVNKILIKNAPRKLQKGQFCRGYSSLVILVGSDHPDVSGLFTTEMNFPSVILHRNLRRFGWEHVLLVSLFIL